MFLSVPGSRLPALMLHFTPIATSYADNHYAGYAPARVEFLGDLWNKEVGTLVAGSKQFQASPPFD